MHLGGNNCWLPLNFGNVSPILVHATNTFETQPHILQLSETLGSFGFLPLRGAGTGFVGILPLPLIFDPPQYILDFTINVVYIIHYISQRNNAKN